MEQIPSVGLLNTLRRSALGVHIAMDGKLWDPARTKKREVHPGKFELYETS